MPNYGPPSELNEPRIRALADTLRDVAASMDRSADRLQTMQAETIWVFGAPTAKKAIGQIRGYLKQINESIDSTATGTPFTSESTKTNHGVVTPPALTKSESSTLETLAQLIAEGRGEINLTSHEELTAAMEKARKENSRNGAMGRALDQIDSQIAAQTAAETPSKYSHKKKSG